MRMVLLAALCLPGQAAGQAAGSRTPAAAAPASLTIQEASRALDAGDPDGALKLVRPYLGTQSPASVAARLITARALIARDDYEGAYRHLAHAHQAAPDNVDVLYYLGVVSARLAAAELDRMARVAPGSARLHQVQAEALVLQGRPHEAASAYETALTRDPALVDALLGLAKLRRTALRCPEAIELYTRAEALRPTFEGAFGLGVCLQHEQQDERAAEQFATATERDPSYALAWQGLGIAAMRLGDLARAAEHLHHAIELEPGLYEAYYALGQVYRAGGDMEKANKAFTAARQLQDRAREQPAPRESPPSPVP